MSSPWRGGLFVLLTGASPVGVPPGCGPWPPCLRPAPVCQPAGRSAGLSTEPRLLSRTTLAPQSLELARDLGLGRVSQDAKARSFTWPASGRQVGMCAGPGTRCRRKTPGPGALLRLAAGEALLAAGLGAARRAKREPRSLPGAPLFAQASRRGWRGS